MSLDNLDFISVCNQSVAFPKHFHQTFCVSLIHSGVEQIDLIDKSVFSLKGAISITNPYELHANPLVSNDAKVSFDTIYISDELMSYFFNSHKMSFFDRTIYNSNANSIFIKLMDSLKRNDLLQAETLLGDLVAYLTPYAVARQEPNNFKEANSYKEILNYIDFHIEDKFDLTNLAKIANINKYGFIKNFKTFTGMTPMSYILMKKVFESKKRLENSELLTHVAQDLNFSDLAHFSNSFKRFVGVSPTLYQENRNIEL